MTARSRTFRIFVSSTFQDLKEERNALQEKVFPRLRELCAQHSARFQAIDLRWGVSEEASVDQQTMNICLGEIERCQQVTPRPNFILLLGDRYGWCPPPPQIPAAEFEQILTVVHDASDMGLLQEWYSRDENAVPPEYYLLPRAGDMTVYENWEPVEQRLQHTLEECARRLGLPPDTLTKYTTSATEQEIMKGAMQIGDAHDHVFGFFRSIEGLPDDESARAFIDLDREGRRDTNSTTKLRDLKRRIGDMLPGNVHQYSAKWLGKGITLDHLDELAEDAYQCLSEVILDEIRSGPPSVEGIHHIPPNKALDEEGLAHHSFAEERRGGFVGRTDILGMIKDYVTATEHTVLGVLGAGGTGKSSVIAKAIEQAHIDHPTAQIVYRFIGTTPDSSNVQSLLDSLCRELGRRYGAGDDKVPGDYHELVTDFITRLESVSATARPLIIFLDALDQLSPQRAAPSLAWIPDPLPEDVRVILSTRPGDIQRSLEQRQAHIVTLHIPPNKALDEEGLAHHSFAEERLGVFVGRTDTLGTIKDYVAATEHTVLGVLGAGGTGKSSVIAKAIEQAHIDHPTAQIVYRFIGTTPDSSNVQSLLDSLCRELGRRYGAGDDKVPGDYRELVADFITRLESVSAIARLLIIFLDALDQLSPQRAVPSLAWVPDPLPEDVRVILSTRPGDIQRSLEQRRARMIILEGLSPEEGNDLLGRWLEAANRTLQEPQRFAVLERFNQSQGRPLYLRLAFEEARRWKSGAGEPPEQLAPGIEGIIEQNLLGRLAKEDNHGEALVSHVLGYLAASRYGLSEDEFLDLLSRDTQVYAWFLRSVFHYPQDILASALEYLRSQKPPFSDTDRASVHNEEVAAQKWLDEVRTREKELDDFLAKVLAKPGGPRLPVVLWSRLYFDLQPYLSSTQAQGTPLLGFFHRELGEVASEQYLAGGSEVPYHRKMADYFQLISDPSGSGIWDGNRPRGLSELPYHLIKGARWDDVLDTLTDFRFLQAKTEALSLRRLIDDYDLARRNGFSEPGLRVIQEALQLSAHVLADDCTQLASQLTGRLLSIDLQPVRSLLDQAQGWDHPWLRPLTASLIQPRGPLLRTLVGHRSPIAGVAFAPDGQRIVSKSGDGTTLTWDLEAEDELLVTKDANAAEREWLNAVIVEDPNNRLTINLEHDIVEVQEGGNEARKATLIGHNQSVTTYAFSPDGTKLVTGAKDHTVRVWELVRASAEDAVEHPGGVTAVAAAQDGARAISGGVDGILRVWDLREGVETATLVGHRDRINALSITPDGQRAVSASSDATLKVWDLSKGVELLSLRGHNGSVRALAVTADGRHTISAGEDQTLKAWDLASGRERSSVEGPQSWDPAIAIAPSGRLAATAYRDHCLRVWDLDRGALVSTCIGHINTVNAVAFSPDGRRLASGSDDQTLRIWDGATGIERARFLGHWDTIRALAFPRNDRLLSLARDDTLQLWDLETGREICQLGGRKVDPSRRSQPPAAPRTGVAPNEPLGLCIRRDGRRGVSFYTNDDTLRLWDLDRGEQIAVFTGDFVLVCCAMAEESSIIAGTRNGRVCLLRLEGADMAPASILTMKEEKAQAKPSGPPAAWRIEPAGSDKQVLVDSGALSNESLRSFSVYRLIHPPTERLARTGTVTLRGFLTCGCGYEAPLTARIGFKGFLNGRSQHSLFCPLCTRDLLLVGERTQEAGTESYWLLATSTTGPPGAVMMPGTASGLPELRINRIEEIASEPAIPSKITEDDQTISGQPEESIDHQLTGTECDEIRTELVAGDVLAMAIVYKGHVIEEPDAVGIANELLTNLSEAGVLTGVKLHLYSTIRIRQADEEAWYRGDYEPGDELPQMLDEGIGELRNRLLSDRRFLGQVNARMVKLKSWSRVVSTCWVGMHILQ